MSPFQVHFEAGYHAQGLIHSHRFQTHVSDRGEEEDYSREWVDLGHPSRDLCSKTDIALKVCNLCVVESVQD